MLMDAQNTIAAVQRATSTRSIEYLRCMTEDAALNERTLDVAEQSSTYNESVDEAETMEIMSQFTADGDEGIDDEVDRIVNSKTDMTFDEMIGISENISPDECASMVESVLMEGVTLDLHNVNRETKKVCREAISKANKYYKNGDKKSAEKELDVCIKSLKELKKKWEDLVKNNKKSEGIIFDTIVRLLIKVPDLLSDIIGFLSPFVKTILVSNVSGGMLSVTVDSFCDDMKHAFTKTGRDVASIALYNQYSKNIGKDIDRAIIVIEKIKKNL